VGFVFLESARMRQHVDLAVLHLQVNRSWFVEQLAIMRSGLSRVTVHDLRWEGQQDYALKLDCDASVDLRTDLLQFSDLHLKRYDALLLPVSVESLCWTRSLLASSQGSAAIPVIGMLHGLQGGAMIDLLELGMVDFVQTAVDIDELRARLLCAISRSPWRQTLRDNAKQQAKQTVTRRATVSGTAQPYRLDCKVKCFNQAKAELIEKFETQFIRDLLLLQKGNVTRAAAAAGKNRRAFWELMRKHDIDANDYRDIGQESGNEAQPGDR